MWLLSLLFCVAGATGTQSPEKDIAISNFLSKRASWQPMCLYEFDGPISNGDAIKNRVPDESCPFDTLQPDAELVTSLNTASSYWQLGVHLAEAPNNDTKRVQLSSISSVSAREFYSTAAVTNSSLNGGGLTIELAVRLQAEMNHSMTLFSIANEFDDCADSGFRLDVNEHQVLALIYFLPVLEEDDDRVEACYEQRLFSVNNAAKCQLPVEKTPAVHITVTLDPREKGRWRTSFYVSYTDPDTMQRVDCVVHDEQHPPSTQVLHKLVKGRYRLYLGNSPRNVTSPRQRRHLSPTRQFDSFGNTGMNATERLRAMLKQKLASIRGPQLPKAMRIFGDNSLSLSILGVTFPPLNEDTPLAYLRSQFADFKEKHGDQIVDYLVNLVQQKAKGPVVTNRGQNSSDESDKFSRASLFQSAGGSTFDLFHFAIYRHVVSEEEVVSISRQLMLPSRQFPSLQQTVRISEDSLVLLNLTLFDGVFNDLRLELRELPEFGQLLLFPSRTPVTVANLDTFRGLQLKHQRGIFFQPEPDQNNKNLPLPNPVAFSRRLKPYATVMFGIADSLAGRKVNTSVTAKIDIFVDAVNDPPRPHRTEANVSVEIGVPVTLDLKGEDVDGVSEDTEPRAGASGSSDMLARFEFTNETTTTPSFQLLKIVKMPKFGRLFNCNADCGSESLESGRIYQNSTEVVNATYSTNLRYIYYGWGRINCESPGNSPGVVDELHYQLSDGDPGVLSSVAVIKFLLVCRKEKSLENENVLSTVRVEEDSLQLVNLGTIDPLAAFFHTKTQLKLSVLPRYGTLFQYHGSESSGANVSLAFVGARIRTPNTTVESVSGYVFYIPKPDYSNTKAHRRISDVDFFEYQVLNTPPTNDSVIFNRKSPAARFINGLEPRRVELEVENVPDSVVILPPFVFLTNASSGEAIQTPVVFLDPDSTNSDDLYQVNIETKDGEFGFGVAITDDDVMSGCPYERPCTLNRSVNGNLTSSRNKELQFYIATQLFDPSHIQVTGTEVALNLALSALSFRDLASNSLNAEFILWVGRIYENGSEQQTETHFTITFQPESQNEAIATGDFVSVLKKRYIPTLLLLVAGWLALSNGSCLSIEFCCCCCGKARKKQRQKLEQQQRLFQEQVAQNDHEYSVLLMDLADILLEPELVVTRCVLEIGSSKYCPILMQAFVWRSLLPLLESERQGTRFVFQLMTIEFSQGIATLGDAASFQHQGFLTQHSTASKVLASFCHTVGASWISALLKVDTSPLELENLLDRITAQLEELPAEVVILCRACMRLFRDESVVSPETELDAVHLVFFNHLLGPALEFPPTFNLSKQQRSTLRALAYQITSFRSKSTGSLLEMDTSRRKYEAVLEKISQSSAMKSAYDSEEAVEVVDCELMGMCLVNIHSLLDSYFLEFKDKIFLAQTPTNVEHMENTLLRLNRLVKALDWPLASIHELLEHAKPELLADPLLWNGFSFQEWQERAQKQQPAPCTTSEDLQSLSTNEFDEVILERDDRSPHDVDWVY